MNIEYSLPAIVSKLLISNRFPSSDNRETLLKTESIINNKSVKKHGRFSMSKQ